MARVLTIAEKFFTLSEDFKIMEGKGNSEQLRFILKNPFWPLTPSWVLLDDQKNEKAKIRWVLFSLSTKWKITGNLGTFYIKKSFFSWNRKYEVKGGPYDGAIIKGNWSDINLEVSLDGRDLIYAEARFFTMSRKHDILIYGDEEDDQKLAAIILSIVMHDKKAEEDDDLDDG